MYCFLLSYVYSSCRVIDRQPVNLSISVCNTLPQLASQLNFQQGSSIVCNQYVWRLAVGKSAHFQMRPVGLASWRVSSFRVEIYRTRLSFVER